MNPRDLVQDPKFVIKFTQSVWRWSKTVGNLTNKYRNN